VDVLDRMFRSDRLALRRRRRELQLSDEGRGGPLWCQLEPQPQRRSRQADEGSLRSETCPKRRHGEVQLCVVQEQGPNNNNNEQHQGWNRYEGGTAATTTTTTETLGLSGQTVINDRGG
jgi:hypothetical protein